MDAEGEFDATYQMHDGVSARVMSLSYLTFSSPPTSWPLLTANDLITTHPSSAAHPPRPPLST